MSYDDYVRHIAQKYRLAVSIAVIRSKPDDVNLEEYVEHLRNSLNDDKMDSDELNISICSEDFQMDQIDELFININENNGEINSTNDMFATIQNNNNKTDQNIESIDVEITDCMQNLDDFDMRDNEATNVKNKLNNRNDIEMIDTQDLDDRLPILHSFVDTNTATSGLSVEKEQRRSLKDVMQILKGIDEDMTSIDKQIQHKNASHSTNNDTLQIQASDSTAFTQYFAENDRPTSPCLDMFPNMVIAKLSQQCSNKLNDTKTQSLISTVVQGDLNIHTHLQDASTVENTIHKEKSQTINKKLESDITISEIEFKSNDTLDTKKVNNRHTKLFKNVYQNVAGLFDANKTSNEHINNNNTVRIELAAISNESSKITDNLTERVHSTHTFDNLNNPKDSQQTIVYTIPEDLKCTSKTHYSESQTNEVFIIDERLIRGANRNKNRNWEGKHNQSTDDKKEKVTRYTYGQETQADSQMLETNTCPMLENNNDKISVNVTSNYSQDIKSKGHIIHVDNDVFSQEMLLSNLSTTERLQRNKKEFEYDKAMNKNVKNNENKNEFSINRHVQSTIENVDKNIFSQELEFTYSAISGNKSQNFIEHSLPFSQNAQDMDKLFQKQSNPENFKDISSSNSCTVFDNNSKYSLITDQYKTFDNNLEHTPNIGLHNEPTSKNDNSVDNSHRSEENNKRCTNNESNYQIKTKDSMQIDLTQPLTNSDAKNNTSVSENCTNYEQIELEDDSQIDRISFKIIEELNKVKVYLNKCDKKINIEGYSSQDTGYRSDSQSRGSLKTSQPSGVWLNQSAYSLFKYITECPLLATTQDITCEIAVVLGQLIDRLHDEEQYPSFLEELLETVQLMLTLLYEDNTAENLLMKKDETVQRILLLNKSIHIQKYTIEKITYILKNLHKELSAKDSLHEIENIDQIENVCYIFQALEIILQRHKKKCENLSQNTQSSQEDEKTLKKSNIMDIWRKKWNPNYKECTNEGSQEKKCVTSSCSSVLNKLIVDCMDGYSLISYYALKCFNVMQS